MHARLITSVTKESDRDSWLQLRQQGLGGSDAAAALGMSRWKSPMELYLEKLGDSPDTPELPEAAYWGTQLESLIAEEFSKRTGKSLEPAPGIFAHPEKKWMLASVDRLLSNEDTFLEIKTASAFKLAEWEGEEVPLEYLLQVQHYLAVTAAKKAYLAVLVGGQHFLHREVKRDEELIQLLMKKEEEFWTHVVNRTPPPVDGSQACRKLLEQRFPGIKGMEITLGDSGENLAKQVLQLKTQKRELEDELTLRENQLKAQLGDAVTGHAGRYRISWTPYSTSRLDTSKLREEYPEIFRECTTQADYRRFTVREVKENGNQRIREIHAA